LAYKLIRAGKIVGYERHGRGRAQFVLIMHSIDGKVWTNICTRPDAYIEHDDKESFISIKDVNGKDIYEGDKTQYGVVEWCNDLNFDGTVHPGYYFSHIYECCGKGSLPYTTEFEDIDVLGNIHD